MMRALWVALTVSGLVGGGCGDPNYDTQSGNCPTIEGDVAVGSTSLALPRAQDDCLHLAGNTVAELNETSWDAGGNLPFAIPIPVPSIIERPFAAVVAIDLEGAGTLLTLLALRSPNAPEEVVDALASADAPTDPMALVKELRAGEAYVFIDNLPAVGGGTVTVGPSVWPAYPGESGQIELTFEAVPVTGGLLEGTVTADIEMGGTTLADG